MPSFASKTYRGADRPLQNVDPNAEYTRGYMFPLGPYLRGRFDNFKVKGTNTPGVQCDLGRIHKLLKSLSALVIAICPNEVHDFQIVLESTGAAKALHRVWGKGGTLARRARAGHLL